MPTYKITNPNKNIQPFNTMLLNKILFLKMLLKLMIYYTDNLL